MKIKFNQVFGYYIEITKSNLEQVPQNYMRKQTLVNAERFITPELKEHEDIDSDDKEARKAAALKGEARAVEEAKLAVLAEVQRSKRKLVTKLLRCLKVQWNKKKPGQSFCSRTVA